MHMHRTNSAAARLLASAGSLLWLQALRAAVAAAPFALLLHVLALRQLRAPAGDGDGDGVGNGDGIGAGAGAAAPPPLLSLDTALVVAASLAWQFASLVLRVASIEGASTRAIHRRAFRSAPGRFQRREAACSFALSLRDALAALTPRC